MKKREQAKKKKLRSNVVKLLKVLVFLSILFLASFYVFNLRIKNIYIEGTTKIKDIEIIEKAGIKDYPKIFRLNTSKIKRDLIEHPLIENVKIKRTLTGKIIFKVEEADILFLYKYNNKYISTNKEEIVINNEYLGYPTLINFTPDTIFEELVNGLAKVDPDIIKLINEIEYTPYKGSDGTIIDNNRFTLKMNDTNTVYIDTPNIKNLNKYTTIIASPEMDQVRGVIYLDTINDNRILFKSYDTINAEKQQALEKEQKAAESAANGG